jgi:peptidoglycan/LPS O-acetylase OafA/YrhL
MAVHSRIEGLDLLRGLAILLVIVHHAWPDMLGSGGIVGVVAFFALSGYLITGILKKDIQRHGRVRYGRFYRNRALRLLPALFLMLTVFVIYTAVVNPFNDRAEIVRSVAVAITYTANIPFDHGSPALGHLWTLATEEQFYLVWPVLLTLGMRWKRLRFMVVIAATVIVISCVASIVVTAPNSARVYTLPSSWAIAMIIGAAAKLGEARFGSLRVAGPSSLRIVGSAAAISLVALSLLPEAKGSYVTYLAGGPLIAILTVGLIFYMRTWVTVPSKALLPLLALGTVSYAAYLWNWPITLWLGQFVDGTARSVLSIVATIAAATISWWAVERPVAAFRTHIDASVSRTTASANEHSLEKQ